MVWWVSFLLRVRRGLGRTIVRVGWGKGGRGGGDYPVFDFISKPWPIGFRPAWSRFVIIEGKGGVSQSK